VVECKPLKWTSVSRPCRGFLELCHQGLTLVHFSAQPQRFCVKGDASRGHSGGVYEAKGCVMGWLGCVFLSEMAQVELRSGRV